MKLQVQWHLPAAVTPDHLRAFWQGLSESDAASVNRRTRRLIDLLVLRYEISRNEAAGQILRFLGQWSLEHPLTTTSWSSEF